MASRSVMIHSPIVDEKSLEFVEATSPGRADASDRHSELGGDASVVRAVVERDDAQQSLAPFVQLLDTGPDPGLLVGDDHLGLGGLLGRYTRLDHLVAKRDRTVAGLRDAPCLA